MADVNTKSYQDGQWNRGFDGKNWGDYSAGSMARAEYERQVKANRDAATAKHGGQAAQQPTMTDGDNEGVGRALLFLLLLPLIIAGIAIEAMAAVLAVFTIPVLKMTEKLLNADERQGLGASYVTGFFTLSAYGLTALAAAFVVWLLGNHIMPEKLHGLSNELATIYAIILDFADPGSKLPTTGPIAGILFLFQLTGITGMVVMLHRWRHDLFSGLRGLLKALTTSLGMLAAGALGIALISLLAALISAI